MSWQTGSMALKARQFLRRTGVNRFLAHIVYRKGYELDFGSKLAAFIRPGDCIWDVGANRGFYTRQFSTLVGPSGTVIAFEPSPINFARLEQELMDLSNAFPCQFGLGSEDTHGTIKQGDDELGATSRLVEHDQGGQVVMLRAGDSLVESGDAPAPNVIKLDVEGYEWEVLQGMAKLLDMPHLRVLGIEVHFTLLQDRGMERVPNQIHRLLSDVGFRLAWVDFSHLVAIRDV